jgi:hypothetical protein
MRLHYNTRWKPFFDINSWLEKNKPSEIRNGTFWDDVHLEYNEVTEEFKSFLKCTDPILDAEGKKLTANDIHSAVEFYKIRIQKLMLIFNLRLYKTFNVNKKTNVRYIVMRAFWYDVDGKPIKWFSRNIGAENKVCVNGKIPTHKLDSVEEDILHLMWDQYLIDLDENYEIGTDSEGNNYIVLED